MQALRTFSTSVQCHSSGKSCDLCGGADFRIISRADRRGKPLDTCVCTKCGLVVHARIPTDLELADFYASHYRQDYHGETTPSARRVVRAWRNGERIYQQLANYVKPGDRVFEVGAGIGCNVKVFQEQGCLSSGIEPGEGFWQFSREKLRANIARCDLMQISPEPRYELVLLVHVIEHLASPTQALTRIRKLLHPGARLYVECPNLAAPFALRSRLFHFAHIHNFTPKTLTMLAEKCGYEVEARFGATDDPNLQMLLRRAGAGRLQVDPQSYPETMQRLSHYNAVTYHLRWSYLWTRCCKLLGYLDERVLARHHLKQILKRCAATEPSGDPTYNQQAA